jgi:hypothetical protein
MTAGLSSRPIAGPKAGLAPQAIVLLIGTVLVAGAIFGAAMTSRLGSVGANSPTAEAAAAQAFIEFRAAERASENVAAAPASSWATQAYRDYRASERASEGATPGSAAPVVSERDALRLEHVAGAIGATGAGKAQDDLVITGRLLPVTSAHASGRGPTE